MSHPLQIHILIAEVLHIIYFKRGKKGCGYGTLACSSQNDRSIVHTKIYLTVKYLLTS